MEGIVWKEKRSLLACFSQSEASKNNQLSCMFPEMFPAYGSIYVLYLATGINISVTQLGLGITQAGTPLAFFSELWVFGHLQAAYIGLCWCLSCTRQQALLEVNSVLAHLSEVLEPTTGA